MLHSLSFAVSYREVKRYEYSVMKAADDVQPEDEDKNAFLHFAFDNADVNVRTMTGHGTFHSMGGVRFTTPASSKEPSSIPRVLAPPLAKFIGTRGYIPVSSYKKPSSPGLKGITIQDICYITTETKKNIEKAMKIDNLWMSGHWAGVESPPSWNGFMRACFNTGEVVCLKTEVQAVPFVNLNPGNPSAIYSALLYAEDECKKRGQKSCLVTFDQPLYAKASEIVASAPDGELDIVFLRLGGFHLLMSFLGCICFFMLGSGLEELWSQVYAPVSVTHMISGHAYSRALRAHFLTLSALTSLLLEKCKDLTSIQNDLKKMFVDLLEGRKSVDSLSDSGTLACLRNVLEQEKTELVSKNRTCRLWVQYMRLVEIVFLFIRAERTGDWQLHLYCVGEMLPYFHAAGHFAYAKSAHLYLQQMRELQSNMDPREFAKFTDEGIFTIRRSHDVWSGVWSDMAIEQDLMRPMKLSGGLTHGRHLNENELSYFVHSFPACLKLCSAVEKFTGVWKETSEQHVELRDSRRTADRRDADIFTSWLRERSPWSDDQDDCLRSLSTGVVGDASINCDQAEDVGRAALAKVVGNTFGNVKLTRKDRVRPLSCVNSSVQIRGEEIPVNPQQLFNRIVWVLNKRTDFTECLKYELAPRPPALFDEISMRKTAKSALLDVFDPEKCPEILPQCACAVVDGGYLLHAVVWPRPATFGQIIDVYIRFVLRHYAPTAVETIVVFDGYEHTSTKGEEQRRRAAKKTSNYIAFEHNSAVTVSQADFLSNGKNKSRLISFLSTELKTAGVTVLQADADADRLIVETALKLDIERGEVLVVAKDTDIAAMLIGRSRKCSKITLLMPGSSTVPGKLFPISKIQKNIGSMKDSVIFCHAMTGCDTTSAFYRQGKKKAWKLLQNDKELQKVAKIFINARAKREDIAKSGEQFALKLYNGKDCKSLNELRTKIYARTVARQSLSSSFDLALLPPTSAAVHQHALRVYLQVQEWLGNSLPPMDWGWKKCNQSLIPIPTTLQPAPEELLNLICCNCKECGELCDCRSAGLLCTMMCGRCNGNCFTPIVESGER